MRLRARRASLFRGSPSSGHQPSTPSAKVLRWASQAQLACSLSKRATLQGSRTVPRKSFSRITRSEEHTSELQSRLHLVCRLLLEKKKTDETSAPVVQRRSASTFDHISSRANT